MALKYSVITISREYGAYGRTIAKALSERLGIPFYDREFVKETARQSGYSEEDIEREGEMLSRAGEFLNNILNNAVVYNSSHDGIYKAQKDVILNLAKESCILVGRCADHILTEAGIDAFKVFLYADESQREKRAMDLEENQGISAEAAKKLVRRRDELRETYYKHYTGNDMGSYKNYNICLDTGVIGVEKCVNILCDILEGN